MGLPRLKRENRSIVPIFQETFEQSYSDEERIVSGSDEEDSITGKELLQSQDSGGLA